MKAFLTRTLLVIVSVILLVQLWIFASLAWWRTNPVNTTMMMRIDYWTEPSNPFNISGALMMKSVPISSGR